MIANHELVHFGGHVMLQSRRRSHVEAFSGRIEPYDGHRVENELVKRDFFCEENLWSRYAAQIRLGAFYASQGLSACLS